jgi:hypothetical protein
LTPRLVLVSGEEREEAEGRKEGGGVQVGECRGRRKRREEGGRGKKRSYF